MDNIYFVKITDKNWVQSYERGNGGCTILPVIVPKKLVVTSSLAYAQEFTSYEEAKKVSQAFGGTVYAPSGGLQPVKTDE